MQCMDDMDSKQRYRAKGATGTPSINSLCKAMRREVRLTTAHTMKRARKWKRRYMDDLVGCSMLGRGAKQTFQPYRKWTSFWTKKIRIKKKWPEIDRFVSVHRLFRIGSKGKFLVVSEYVCRSIERPKKESNMLLVYWKQLNDRTLLHLHTVRHFIVIFTQCIRQSAEKECGEKKKSTNTHRHTQFLPNG